MAPDSGFVIGAAKCEIGSCPEAGIVYIPPA